MLRYEETVAQGGLKVIHPRWKKLDETGLVIPQQGGKWRASATGLRRAMLNNFGAAGSNAALLLEEAAMFPDSRPSTRTRSALVFNLSAKTPIALQDTIEDHLEFLEGKRDVDLMDICYTATARRQVYDYRISLVCASMDDLKTKLRNVEAAKVRTFENKRNMIFVFTGQGSIYPGMGEELMWSSSLFREWVLRCDTMIQQLGYDSILPYVNSKESKDILKAFSNPLVTSQLACVVVEYALAQLLISFGITPNCVIGHR